jgi:NAD-dependent SIR2 family protein deacetylase
MPQAPDTAFARCAELIQHAEGLLITAGAGMGVDSGLPDFRGTKGFWRAYPALALANIRFEEIASPSTFETNPALAWGFYGHRLKQYRETVPHQGFRILRDIADMLPQGAFVFTSNMDGQFQKAGFSPNRLCEIHGSIHHLQCQHGCMNDIRDAAQFKPQVDETRCLLTSAPPRCPHCDDIARPNILMFGDWKWIDDRMRQQHARLDAWLAETRRVLTIEIGAGTHIPTVRHMSEFQSGPLIRINPTEAEVRDERDVGLVIGKAFGEFFRRPVGSLFQEVFGFKLFKDAARFLVQIGGTAKSEPPLLISTAR